MFRLRRYYNPQIISIATVLFSNFRIHVLQARVCYPNSHPLCFERKDRKLMIHLGGVECIHFVFRVAKDAITIIDPPVYKLTIFKDVALGSNFIRT